MKRLQFAVAIIFLFASPSFATTITGYVVSITDGDIIVVLDANRLQHKIRVAGIDAPEKAQPFGDRSKQNLAALAFDKNVTVERNKQDRYGRTVGKVMVNGTDANLALGQAWVVPLQRIAFESPHCACLPSRSEQPPANGLGDLAMCRVGILPISRFRVSCGRYHPDLPQSHVDNAVLQKKTRRSGFNNGYS